VRLSGGTWDGEQPALLDTLSGDATSYVLAQLLLEKSLGAQLARFHSLRPPPTAFMSTAHKLFSTGMKKYFMAPRRAYYHMYGCVLYEYSPRDRDAAEGGAAAAPAAAAMEQGSTPAMAGVGAGATADEDGGREHEGADRNDGNYIRLLNGLFGAGGACDEQQQQQLQQQQQQQQQQPDLHRGQFLSYMYPLVDIKVVGPSAERLNNRQCHSITFSRKDGKSMRVMKRDVETDPIQEHHKATVTLIFESEELALRWKEGIEKASTRQSRDLWNGEHPFVDERRKKKMERTKVMEVDELIISSSAAADAAQQAFGDGQGGLFRFDWQVHSAVGKLVVPTAGLGVEEVQRLKIEVGVLLSSARKG